MSGTVVSDACRVGVHFESTTMDFVLPADVSVAMMIPSIVHRVATSSPDGWQEVPTDWQLSRLEGCPISSRSSLRDNDVRDGDVLLLSRVGAALPAPPTDDPIAEISSSLGAMPRWTPAATQVVVATVTLYCTGLTGFALLQAESLESPVIAAALATVALIAAVAYARAYQETLTAVTLGISAMAWAAVAAYRAVPGAAAAPKLMLAGAVGATVSVLVMRYTASGITVFSATASCGLLVAAAACLRVFLPVHVAAMGAVLAAVAAGLLMATARLAIWAGRLPVPRLPAASARNDSVLQDIAGRARHVHAIITGLICGLSTTAAFGAGIAAYAGPLSCSGYATLIGVVLVLRAGMHVDLVQSAALIASGTACFGPVFFHVTHAWPQHQHWISLVAVVAAAATIGLSSASRPPSTSPIKRRLIELTEYAALACIVPLACWVCGVFTVVRGLNLS